MIIVTEIQYNIAIEEAMRLLLTMPTDDSPDGRRLEEITKALDIYEATVGQQAKSG